MLYQKIAQLKIGTIVWYSVHVPLCEHKSKRVQDLNIKDFVTGVSTGRGKLTIKLMLILCFNLV